MVFSSTVQPASPVVMESVPCLACGGAGTPIYRQHDLFCGIEGEFGQRRCDGCGSWFLSPRPTEESSGRHYAANYMPYQKHPSGWIHRLSQMVGFLAHRRRTLHRFVKGGKILDVGCGNGSFLQNLEPAVWQRHAMDISQNCDLGPEVPFYAGQFDHEPPPVSGLDAITLWHVFEHLYHPEQALRNASELLSPGGHLFLAIPDLQCLERRIFGPAWIGWDPPRHVATYSRRAMEDLVGRSGLRLAAVLPDYCNGDMLALNIEWLLRSKGMERNLRQSLLVRLVLTPPAAILGSGQWAPAKVYVAQK